MLQGWRKAIVILSCVISFTVIAVMVGIEAAKEAMTVLLTLAGMFVGGNLVEHNMKKKAQ